MPRWDAAKGMSISTDEQDVYLWQCLLHSSPRILDEQSETYERFRAMKEQIDQAFRTGYVYPWASLTNLRAPKFFGDIIESLIGAIYIDSDGNLGAVRQVLDRLGILSILHRIIRDEIDTRHPISRLQQWSTKFRDRKVDFDSSVDNRTVTVKLLVNGKEYHTVTEHHKGKHSQEEAKFRAAEEGIKILERVFGSDGEIY